MSSFPVSIVEPNLAPWCAVVQLHAGETELQCVSVSTEGLTLRVPGGAPQAELVAGRRLTVCALRRAGVVLLEEQGCLIDRTERLGADDGALLVSLAFEPRALVATPLRIANAQRIRAVLASGRHWSVGSDDGVVAQRFSSLTLGGDTLALTGPLLPPGAAWLPGRPVTLRLEHEGRPLQGYARLLRASQTRWELALPLALIEVPPRGALTAAADRVDATLSFVCPVSGRPVRRRLLELSTRGARFSLEPADVLPPGLRVQAVLELGAEQLQVESVVEAAGEGERGLRWSALPERTLFVLIDFLSAHRLAGARGAEGTPYESLSAMFRSEGVAPPRPTRPAPGLSKAFVLLRDGEPVGHVAGLRIYSRTWLSQHLLVRAGVHDAASRSQQLMTLSLEAGEAMPDVEYVRALWRTSSKNVAHIKAASSDRLLRPGLVYRTSFEQMRLPLGPLPQPGPFFVREAGAADEAAFFAFVAATEEPVKLLSDDLVPGELHLESLSARFGAAGHCRGRSLTVVDDEQGAPLGWALLQTMSSGLAWSELLSSFRLFIVDGEGPLAQGVRLSLSTHAAHFFAAMGRGEATCHAAPGDLSALGELGFVSQGGVCEFGAHRSALPDFTRQLVSALTRLPQREPKRRVQRSGR